MVKVYNNQRLIELSPTLLQRLEKASQLAENLAIKNPANGGGVLASLDAIEVSIVDDFTIDRVHRDFMQIEGATDVITFAHGEIVVSAETAMDNANEYANSFEGELMLYIVHGLLHLSGHEDEDPSERKLMETLQYQILSEVWN